MTRHKLQQQQQHEQKQSASPGNKSLLEEVLNAPSNKAASHLSSPLLSSGTPPRKTHHHGNGTPMMNGVTVHHTPNQTAAPNSTGTPGGGNGIKKELLSKCSPKLLNGDSTPIKKTPQVSLDFIIIRLQLLAYFSMATLKYVEVRRGELLGRWLKLPTPSKGQRNHTLHDVLTN